MTEPNVPLRLSATILLLRDQPDLQVLMVKRHHEIDFASGALVFPGGKTVPGDESDEWRLRSDGGFEGAELATRVAAVRETFEEAGVLLARHAADTSEGGPLVGGDVAQALSPMREPVDRGDVAFLDVVKQHDLILTLDRLVHFGHWITPDMMPKRFDTHFYLAVAPEGQVAEQDGREATEAIWIEPQAALSAEAAGELTIVFPTRMTLGRLALVSRCEQAMHRFTDAPVITVQPEIHVGEDGTTYLQIPQVEGYGVTMEPLNPVREAAFGPKSDKAQ